MNSDFVFEIIAEDGFNVLNRMVNTCNRRRNRIKSLHAFIYSPDNKEATIRLVVYTNWEEAVKIQKLFDKIIEVQKITFYENTPAMVMEGIKAMKELV